MEKVERKCRNCAHWLWRMQSLYAGKQPQDDHPGECRVNPPVFHPTLAFDAADGRNGFWPETRGADWCARFDAAVA